MERSPAEWRDHLVEVLKKRRPEHRRLRCYYDGEQGLPTAPQRTTDTYRRLAALGMTNMCGLVVDAVNERLRPKGVRLTEEGDADLVVWRAVWRANHLDGDWSTAQEEALKIGRCPVLVWPTDPADSSAGVSVTVEDADEVAVAYAPGSRRERVAALKVYTDGEYSFAMVWTATEVVAWTCEGEEAPVDGDDWVDDPVHSGPNPLGAVPVVELLSKPSVRNVPAPELSRAVIALQDRINKTMFDTVVAAEFGAFPQRYAIGIEVQTDTAGNPINPLTTGPNRAWILEQSGDASATVGQLEPFPLDRLLSLADASIKHLASISRTPVYYLLSGMTNVGADAIRAAETGHVAKIIGHQTRFGEAAVEVFRLALIAGGVVSPPADIEIQWAPPETRSPAELADAAIKLRQAGYPFDAIARYMGETPSTIERLTAERQAELAAAPDAKSGAPAAPPA